MDYKKALQMHHEKGLIEVTYRSEEFS